MSGSNDHGLRALPTAALGAMIGSEPRTSDAYHQAIMTLHLRGGAEEFALGEALSRSERASAAYS